MNEHFIPPEAVETCATIQSYDLTGMYGKMSFLLIIKIFIACPRTYILNLAGVMSKTLPIYGPYTHLKRDDDFYPKNINNFKSMRAVEYLLYLESMVYTQEKIHSCLHGKEVGVWTSNGHRYYLDGCIYFYDSPYIYGIEFNDKY